jgi:DNA-binding transcriptional LysR family regulator
MNLRQMEVFHAIMRAGSVTAAARLLNVTQPAVSTVLRHCESQLRVKLFDRIGGRLFPTPEAHAIYPDIANIFQRVDTVTRITQDLVGGRLGQITIAATFAAANGPLAGAVAEFVRKRPAVKVAIHALPSVQVIERVARREADFGLCFGPARDPAIEAELLKAFEIACIMPSNHPLARLESVPIEALAGQDIITYAPHTPIGKPVEEAFRAAGIELQRRIQVNYSMTAFILAAQGAGIALVEPMLLSSSSMPSLVARPIRPLIEVRVLLVQAIGRPATKTSLKLVELIRSHIDRLDRSDAAAWVPEVLETIS